MPVPLKPDLSDPELRKRAKWRTRFLGLLSQCGNITKSIQRAPGCSREKVKKELESNPEFAQHFEMAMEMAMERFEAEADRRGIEGVDKPVFYKGKQCGTIKEYSDILLIFRMKALAPQKYRDNPKPSDINVNINLKRDIDSTKKMLSDPEAFRLADELSRRLALPPPAQPVASSGDDEIPVKASLITHQRAEHSDAANLEIEPSRAGEQAE